MQYLLTYGVIDNEFGNYLYHSFLVLSILKEGKKVEVVDTWGFYGLPSTSGYDLSLMSSIIKNQTLEKDKIYIKFTENGFNYITNKMQDCANITNDEIAGIEKIKNIKEEADKLDALRKFLPAILSIISKKGHTTTTLRDAFISKIKKAMHFEIDLKGNHGMLRHEEVRYLDTGAGLHGVTFHLPQEKFNELRNRCVTLEKKQTDAIQKAALTLQLEPKQDFKIYPYEHYSQDIYLWDQQQPNPGLYPFGFELDFTLSGPDFTRSHTCKSQILSLLTGILSAEQINRLTENGKHPTLPWFNGRLEKIYLHSRGPLRKHRKASGEICYYRKLEDQDVKLYWTLPPQEIDTPDSNIKRLLTIDTAYCDTIKKIIHQLQKLEWLFTNAVFPTELTSHQEKVIQHIQKQYEVFSTPHFPHSTKTKDGWQGWLLWSASMARNENEADLIHKINSAKQFINELDFAISNQWEIDKNLPFGDGSDDTENENPIAALARYLSVDDQKKLCKIIKRGYTAPDRFVCI